MPVMRRSHLAKTKDSLALQTSRFCYCRLFDLQICAAFCLVFPSCLNRPNQPENRLGDSISWTRAIDSVKFDS